MKKTPKFHNASQAEQFKTMLQARSLLRQFLEHGTPIGEVLSVGAMLGGMAGEMMMEPEKSLAPKSAGQWAELGREWIRWADAAFSGEEDAAKFWAEFDKP